MNPLLQLIEEQKKELEELYSNFSYYELDMEAGEKIIGWHTSSIKAILQAQVEMLEKSKTKFGSIDPIMQAVSKIINEYIDSQINLLQETINSMK